MTVIFVLTFFFHTLSCTANQNEGFSAVGTLGCWVMMRTFVGEGLVELIVMVMTVLKKKRTTRSVLAFDNGRPMLISALGAAETLKWEREIHSVISFWGPHACQKQLVMASSRWSLLVSYTLSSQLAVISQAHSNFHISQWITGSIRRARWLLLPLMRYWQLVRRFSDRIFAPASHVGINHLTISASVCLLVSNHTHSPILPCNCCLLYDYVMSFISSQILFSLFSHSQLCIFILPIH